MSKIEIVHTAKEVLSRLAPGDIVWLDGTLCLVVASAHGCTYVDIQKGKVYTDSNGATTLVKSALPVNASIVVGGIPHSAWYE